MRNLNAASPLIAVMEALPERLLTTAMYHLVGAMPLRAWSPDGLTVYALTVVGAAKGGRGGATLAGPAVDAAGLVGWPTAAQHAAAALLTDAQPRRAGGVAVVAILQSGHVSDCAVIHIPPHPSGKTETPGPAPAGRRRGRR